MVEMEQIERKLALFKELIRCGHDLYFWSYDRECTLLDTTCPLGQQFRHVLNLNPKTFHALLELSQYRRPVMMNGQAGLVWLADFLFDAEDTLQRIYAVGPVYMEDPSRKAIDRMLFELDLLPGERSDLRQLLTDVPVLSINRFFDFGLMLHYCITEERISISEFRYPNIEPEQQRGNDSGARTDSHGTWAMEQELMRLVEAGDLEYKKKAARLVSTGRVGQLGNGDPVRNLKNMTIVFTALCMRAAIRGGLTPEIAHTLSDQYISAIEAGNTFAEVAEVNAAMQEDFVQRVHKARTEQGVSPQVQNCINYIHFHYAEKLEMSTLAEKIGYSPSHLGKLFKQETGMTIKQYIMNYRIDRAKDALRLSGESISSICHRMGFDSPSYFGKHFRLATGMTPLEYRETQGVTAKS